MSVLKLISENPFRILGVYSNARPSEVISNCDEMEVYLSIGQSIQFDTDFNKILLEVTRTKELVEQAKRQII